LRKAVARSDAHLEQRFFRGYGNLLVDEIADPGILRTWNERFAHCFERDRLIGG